MNALIYRNCPNCYSDQPILLFKLRFDQFVMVNPTHNRAWFESLGFTHDTKFHFVKCANCDFVYSESRLNDKLNYQFYHDGIDSQKSLKKIFSIDKKLKQLLIWYNLLYAFSLHVSQDCDLSERKLKVLDFGAGWGDFLAAVKAPGIDVFGLEFDRNKIDYANSIGISVGSMEFIAKNAPYDIFICNQVLEHLDKPKEGFRTLRRFLNKHAVGFVSVPNFSSGRMDKFIKDIEQGKSVIKEINPWGHLNYFTPDSLRQMILDSEFSEIQTPFELQSGLINLARNELSRSTIQKFLVYQYKAFSVLLGKIINAKQSWKQLSTSIFIKFNKYK